MKSNFFKKIKVLLVLGISIFGFVKFAYASTTFKSELQGTAGTAGVFEIDIKIDSTESINAVSGSLDIPQDFTFINASDGDSIINFWVEKPHFDISSSKFSFSGITPGGFSGQDGKIVSLFFRSKKTGPHQISWESSSTKALINGPKGEEDIISVQPLDINVVDGASTQTLVSTSGIIPEHFLISVVKDSLISNNQSVIIFSTQDKGSGIAYYEVSEKSGEKVTDYSRLNWYKAESPYVLKDQLLHSFIYVKAVDQNGNERVEIMPPQHPLAWYDYVTYILIGVIFLVILLRFIALFIKKKYAKKYR